MLRCGFLSLLSVFALVPLLSLASRLPPNLIAEVHSEAFPGGLKRVHNHLQGLKAAGLKRRESSEDWTERTAYATIKFTVPPSVSDEFEEAWMMLEKEVDDKEDGSAIFDLKKTSLDNLFYLSYGEWDSVDAFVQHLESDHFKDFAEAADDLGIRWTLQCLEDLSEDLEKHERGRKEHERRESKREEKEDLAHVLIYYIVPPAETDGFVDVWRETAERTLKEERGNRVFSLASLKDDNTRFYGYGTWDSMDDYLDHFQSSHVRKLREYLEDRDIIYFVAPLRKIGNQPE